MHDYEQKSRALLCIHRALDSYGETETKKWPCVFMFKLRPWLSSPILVNVIMCEFVYLFVPYSPQGCIPGGYWRNWDRDGMTLTFAYASSQDIVQKQNLCSLQSHTFCSHVSINAKPNKHKYPTIVLFFIYDSDVSVAQLEMDSFVKATNNNMTLLCACCFGMWAYHAYCFQFFKWSWTHILGVCDQPRFV